MLVLLSVHSLSGSGGRTYRTRRSNPSHIRGRPIQNAATLAKNGWPPDQVECAPPKWAVRRASVTNKYPDKLEISTWSASIEPSRSCAHCARPTEARASLRSRPGPALSDHDIESRSRSMMYQRRRLTDATCTPSSPWHPLQTPSRPTTRSNPPPDPGQPPTQPSRVQTTHATS